MVLTFFLAIQEAAIQTNTGIQFLTYPILHQADDKDSKIGDINIVGSGQNQGIVDRG